MNSRHVFAFTLAVCALAQAQTAKTSDVTPQQPSSEVTKTDKEYVGEVSLLLEINDEGKVLSTRVIHGVNKQVDQEAARIVRGWRFTPAKKDGKPVSVQVKVDVKLLRDSNGKLAVAPPKA